MELLIYFYYAHITIKRTVLFFILISIHESEYKYSIFYIVCFRIKYSDFQIMKS